MIYMFRIRHAACAITLLSMFKARNPIFYSIISLLVFFIHNYILVFIDIFNAICFKRVFFPHISADQTAGGPIYNPGKNSTNAGGQTAVQIDDVHVSPIFVAKFLWLGIKKALVIL